MRTFSADFTAMATSEFARQFWTLVIHFPGGDRYFADHAWTVDGNLHEAAVSGWGEISGLVDREEKTLDVARLTIDFTNLPVLSGGVRISELLAGNVETIQATLYCNFMDTTGFVAQEIVFVGLIESPISYDFQTAHVTLLPVEEAYLNRTALRILAERDFPSLRKSDIGSTVPIIFGQVPRCPGRAVQGTVKRLPIADPLNTSSAKLLNFEVFAGAIPQDWMVEFTAAEVQSFSGPVDTNYSVGAVAALPTYDASTDFSGLVDANGGEVTWSHTCGGARRILFVHVNTSSYNRLTATYNNLPMSLVYTSNSSFGAAETRVFALYDPPTGAHTIKIVNAYQLDVGIAAVALSLNDCGFAKVLFNAFNFADQSGVSFTFSGANISRNVDFIGTRNSGIPSPTASGQTLRERIAYGADWAGTSTRATQTGNVVQMAWSLATAGNIAYALALVPGTCKAYAQSFQTSTSQLLSGVTIELRKDPSATGSANINVFVQIHADNSGEPAATVSRFAILSIPASTTSFTNFTATFEPFSLSPSTTYWIVVRGFSGGSLGVGSFQWRANSSGGYANGNAQVGEDTISQFTALIDVASKPITWLGGLTAVDFVFRAIFLSGTYSVYGSVEGYDGNGNITADFLSTSGQIGIAAADWQGVPAAGDRFCFTVAPPSTICILSESPSATPIQAIGTVYWGDVAISDATISNLVSLSTAYEVGGLAGQRAAQSFSVTTGMLVTQISIVAARIGSPNAKLTIEVVRATNGPQGISGSTAIKQFGAVPSSSSVSSGEVASSTLTPLLDTVTVIFPEPLALEPGRYFLIISATAIGDNTNHFSVQATTSLLEGELFLYSSNTANGWYNYTATTGLNIAIMVTAASITKSLAADDGTGNYVASVTIDAALPDNISVSADVSGITDGTNLIVRPDKVVHWLLNFWDIDDTLIDTAAFDAAGTHYASFYRFDGVAQDSGTRKALLLQLAFESRSALAWPLDGAAWNFLPVELFSADTTIDSSDIVLGPAHAPMQLVRRTDTIKIVNFVDLRYRRRAVEGRALTAYDSIVNSRNLASIEGRGGEAGYGQRDRAELFMTDFVRNESMAHDLSVYYAQRLAFPRRIVESTTKLHQLVIEQDDVLAFDSAILDASSFFLVIGTKLDLTRRRPVLICEEVVFTAIEDIQTEAATTQAHDCFIQIGQYVEPLILVIDERWEPDVQEPDLLVIDERWELTISEPGVPGTAGQVVIDERWEN